MYIFFIDRRDSSTPRLCEFNPLYQSGKLRKIIFVYTKYLKWKTLCTIALFIHCFERYFVFYIFEKFSVCSVLKSYEYLEIWKRELNAYFIISYNMKYVLFTSCLYNNVFFKGYKVLFCNCYAILAGSFSIIIDYIVLCSDKHLEAN